MDGWIKQNCTAASAALAMLALQSGDVTGSIYHYADTA